MNISISTNLLFNSEMSMCNIKFYLKYEITHIHIECMYAYLAIQPTRH